MYENDVLDGNAVDQNEDQCNNIHHREHANHDILHININLSSFRHANQHPTDAELDRYNSSAIANFEDEEELVDCKWWLVFHEIQTKFDSGLTFCASAEYFSFPGFASVVV